MANIEKATFAAGCFWGIEFAFRKVQGVIDVQVGYIGGQTKNPTYKEVCSGTTGHAEAVEITFDPEIVSYAQLLDLFWNIHDPCSLNRQGPDVGSQYRSAIFYHNETQRELAKREKAALIQAGKKVVSEIIPATSFTRAEEYHQRYHEKHGGSCKG